MDELSKDDSKASEDRPIGRDTEELLKRGRDLLSVPVMDLILWGKKRKELPPLSRDLWKRVAARCYRDALVVSDMIPSESKWVRLVCGSLLYELHDSAMTNWLVSTTVDTWLEQARLLTTMLSSRSRWTTS